MTLTKRDYYIAGLVSKQKGYGDSAAYLLWMWYGLFLMFALTWGAVR